MRATLLLALFFLGPLSAESLVGKEAPAFKAEKAVNLAAPRTLEDFKGEVTLIRFW